MIKMANESKVVLIGRGGQALLSGRSDALHVRIFAAFEQRVEAVMADDDICKEEAERLIRKLDGNRERYLKRHYAIDWKDPRHYHMTINTGLVDISKAARMIVSAA
jgi:cytidylate kinase